MITLALGESFCMYPKIDLHQVGYLHKIRNFILSDLNSCSSLQLCGRVRRSYFMNAELLHVFIKYFTLAFFLAPDSCEIKDDRTRAGEELVCKNGLQLELEWRRYLRNIREFAMNLCIFQSGWFSSWLCGRARHICDERGVATRIHQTFDSTNYSCSGKLWDQVWNHSRWVRACLIQARESQLSWEIESCWRQASGLMNTWSQVLTHALHAIPYSFRNNRWKLGWVALQSVS